VTASITAFEPAMWAKCLWDEIVI